MPETYVYFGGLRVDISQFDFNDHSSRIADVQTANIILIALVVFIVSLRLFARAYCVKQIFVDDVLIILAAAFTIALAATCIAATRVGLGTHIWQFPMASMFEQVKSCILYLFVCQILYACAIALTKAAIICAYLRFIQTRKFRLVMYATSLAVFGLFVCGIFVSVFQCKPISGAWDFTVQKSCINYVDYLYASSSINVLTDLVLCISPMPHLWNLNMPRKQRIILCVLFTGGAGACIAGFVRIGFLHTLRITDVSYQSVPSLNLSVIECSLGIICVSVPALRPLAVRIFPNGLRTIRPSSNRTKSMPLSNLSAKATVTTTITSDTHADEHGFQRLSSIEAAR